MGGLPYTRGHLYRILTNPIYVGMVHHKGATYDGQHNGIVDPAIWQQVQEKLRIGEQRQVEDANAEQDAIERSGTDGAADSLADRPTGSNASDSSDDVEAHEHHAGFAEVGPLSVQRQSG